MRSLFSCLYNRNNLHRALLRKSNAVVTLANRQSEPPAQELEFLWPLANCVTDVAHCMNQRWIADFLSQSSDENFHQLRVIFVLVFPDAFAQSGAGESAARLPHKHFQQHQLAF